MFRWAPEKSITGLEKLLCDVVQMEIDPVNSVTRGWVDGVLIGSAGLPRVSDQVNSDHFATAFAASTPAEYDAARVAVCVP
jgi:hypothetical protein